MDRAWTSPRPSAHARAARTAIALAFAPVVACARPAPTAPPLGETHVAGGHARSDARRTVEMRRHYDDLRFIDGALRAGRLREARTLAYWLARAPQDPHVQAGARTLASAPTLVAALDAQARIAGACGRCHRTANVQRTFEREAIAPRDDDTLASHLARHRWAAARLVDGIVGDSEPQWRAALVIFTNDISGHRISVAASRALEAPSRDRAAIYGELLVACTACHPRSGQLVR